MRVGFYLDTAAPPFLRLAELAIEQVRRNVPGAEVLHLTSAEGPRLSGVDGEIRVDAPFEHYAQRRAVVQAEAPAPILLLDVDAHLRRPVPEVLAQPYDLAVPEVADPFVRYTGAVMFVRDGRFWKGWCAHPVWDEPFELRRMLMAFCSHIDGCGGRILRLPQDVYEALPKHAEDLMPGAAIAHYRGPRKDWIPGL